MGEAPETSEQKSLALEEKSQDYFSANNLVIHGQVHRGQVHRGPLPPPGDLLKYGAAFPELPETIVSMATKEQDHRHQTDTIIVKSIPLGLWLAFWLGITGILVASVLFFMKESWPALFIIPAGLMPAIFSALRRRD